MSGFNLNRVPRGPDPVKKGTQNVPPKGQLECPSKRTTRMSLIMTAWLSLKQNQNVPKQGNQNDSGGIPHRCCLCGGYVSLRLGRRHRVVSPLWGETDPPLSTKMSNYSPQNWQKVISNIPQKGIQNVPQKGHLVQKCPSKMTSRYVQLRMELCWDNQYCVKCESQTFIHTSS